MLGGGRETDWGEGCCAQCKLGLGKTKSVCGGKGLGRLGVNHWTRSYARNGVLGVGVVTHLKDWRNQIT